MLRNALLCILVVLLGTSPFALAQTWDGGGADDRWLTPENWDTDTLPAAGVRVSLEEDGGTILVEAGDFVNPRKILGPTYTTPVTTTLTFTGGALENTSYWYVGMVSLGTGIVNVTGPTVDIYTRDLNLGDNGGTGILNMTAGVVEIFGSTAGTGLYLPWQGGELSQGQINLDGGVITVNHMVMYDGGVIDIGGNGRLEVAGDQRTQIQDWMDADMITAEDDTDDVVVLYDGAKTILMSPNNTEFLLKAWAPMPPDGPTVPEPQVTLSWNPGATADKHDVYFGTDPANLTQVANDIDPCSFTLPPLAFGTTYYWRVDEVDLDTPATYTGDVWSFDTRGVLEVEEFEDYPGDPNLQLVWSTSGGAAISLSASPAQGIQAMEMTYDNTLAPFLSEASATPMVTDFTSYGVVQLQVWSYGNTSNSAEKMYIVLDDGANTAVVQSNDTVTQAAEWNIWRIALTEFTAANPAIDLTSIDTLTVGIGDKNSPQVGGTGVMVIDNFRLREAQCLNPPVNDLTDDCEIDLEDLAALSTEWLFNGIWP